MLVDVPQVDVPEDDESPIEAERWRPTGVLEWFAIGQTALPALMYLPGNQQFRFAIRAGSFLVSMGVFAYWWTKGRPRLRIRHPAAPWLLLVATTLGVMVGHPDTSSLAAGLGQMTLYVAVFAPLFWVPMFVTDRRTLLRVLVVLLLCNGINSLVGVMQVYDPDRWMPAEFSATFMQDRNMLGTALYVGANGRLVVRPPGLFDTPGAVCGAGTVATLLGLIFFLERMAWWKRLGAFTFAGAGLAAIYLSHVRSSLVVALGMLVVYIALLSVQHQKTRAVALLGLGAGLVVGALLLATLLGGDSVQHRFLTFFEESPTDLYYRSRGNQVHAALTDRLREFPAGAGLGRWGVMSSYLGVPASTQIGAEVQPLAWVLDGGIVLLFGYGLALLSTVVWELRLIRRLPDRRDRLWAAAVVAANIGTLALVFTFVPFATQIGMQFWFLEGLLHGAMAMQLQSWP
jgi:hypothetical protein